MDTYCEIQGAHASKDWSQAFEVLRFWSLGRWLDQGNKVSIESHVGLQEAVLYDLVLSFRLALG